MPTELTHYQGSAPPRPARGELISRGSEALSRIRGDYFEMPGLRLTVAQGARLWGLSRETCAELLDELVREQFLAHVGQNYSRR
jgi:Fic family protein